jgi:ribulose-phosphate 3-epimerase
MSKIKISPSILSADFSILGREIEKLNNSGADMIHIDVMDGNFVPNLTIGPPVIESLKKHSKIPFDVHLMINNPENYINDYINAGADYLTFHIEASSNSFNTIKLIKERGVKVGIALKPKTSAEILSPYIKMLDLVLVMAVEPGFGGQSFMPEQLKKIKQIHEMSVDNADLIISVDGGINKDTAKKSVAHGANMLVSGSYLFENNNLTKAIMDLRNLL